MFRLPGLCNSMCYFPAEEETKRVFVEANGFPGAREGGKQSGRKETLYIDYFVVPIPAYLFQHAQQVAGLFFLFIPDQYFMQVRVVLQKAFVTLSYQEVDLCIRVKQGQFLHQCGSQHHVADKSGLYDEKLFHVSSEGIDKMLFSFLESACKFAKKQKMELQQLIVEAWANRDLLKEAKYADAVRNVLEEVDKGRLRTASPSADGWQVNEWVKQAILMYFAIQQMETYTLPPFEFYDKMKLKSDYAALGVRAVPHAVARYGAYLAKNVVLMPSYVNIGAYVDEGTMVDTWATVGSCAQIGKGVHLSGGVGIGGVLEPLQASPVIIEDGCFIGSRCIVVEGVRVEKEAVLGANVVLTQSTKIIDVSGSEPKEMKGVVPARSVVIPGTYTKKFPAGAYGVGCALIIGQRKPSTDLKTSLNDALRDFNVSV